MGGHLFVVALLLVSSFTRGFLSVGSCWGLRSKHFSSNLYASWTQYSSSSTRLESLKNPEQTDVGSSSGSGGGIPKDDAWLRQISDYGNARMAKKAIGVLDKMRSFNIKPNSEHYEEVLLACEKSDQFDQAITVYNLMNEDDVKKTERVYEAMTSVAEKNGKWEESIEFLNTMKKQGLQPSTKIYNSCMWAADRGGHWELAIAMLEDMESENIPRDEVTYSACTWACEKGK